MASVAIGVLVSINGVDLSCVLQSLNMSAKADVLQNTTLCATSAHTHQKALTERSLSGAGFFKSSTVTAENAHGLFNTALDSVAGNYLLLYGRDGATDGALAELMNLVETKYDINTVVGEFVGVTFDAQTTKTDSANNYQIGVFLFNQTVTGATNGATYDSTSGGTGYLIQIHNLAGDGTAAVIIQHSTNGSTWADLVATANYAVASGTQVANTATSVNRYLRAVVTPNGTTNRVAIGIKVGYTG